MPSPVVRFRCPPDLRDRIDAARGDESLSGWVKDAIRHRLNGRRGDSQNDETPQPKVGRHGRQPPRPPPPPQGIDRPPASKGARRDDRPRCSDHPSAVVLAGRCGVCDGKVT